MSGLNYLNKSKRMLLEEFQQFFYKQAAPLLPDYEAKRGNAKINLYASNAMLLGFVLLILFNAFKICLIAGCVCIVGGALVVVLSNPGKKNVQVVSDYEITLKNKLMPSFLSIFGNFKWEKYIPSDFRKVLKEFRTLRIFPVTHYMAFDDIISGEYGGVKLKLLEVRTGFRAIDMVSIVVLAVVASVSFSIYFTVVFAINFAIVSILATFNKELSVILFFIFLLITLLLPVVFVIGYCIYTSSSRFLVAEFDMPKNFSGSTCVYEKAGSAKKLIFKKKTGMQPVNLEDVKFSALYNIYSTDQIEARYLLTTAFMERFLNIKTAFKAEYIRAEFFRNKLILVIGVNKDLFAMGSISKKTTGKTFVELFEELYSVLSLIDELKLNQKTGL